MVNTKAVFLLALVDNDGRSLAAEILEVRTQLWERLTAYTIEGQVQRIFQMADGSRAVDVNEKYSVNLDEARLSELEQVLRDFKAKTLQEKIYLEIHWNVELRLI